MKTIIKFKDFLKLDMRVGKIVKACVPEWSEKLLEFTVDFGEEIGEKKVLSGIRKWYQVDKLLGKKYVFIVNLEERKMGEAVSQGMMLMACEGEKPQLVPVSDDIQVGTEMC